MKDLLRYLHPGELAWSVYDRLPEAWAATADRSWQYVSAIKRGARPITRFEGLLSEDGQTASVIVVDNQPSMEYFVRRLFDGPTESKIIGKASPGQLPTVLDELAADADLLLARVSNQLTQQRMDARYLRVPEAVESLIEVPEDGTLPARARRSHARNLRVMHRNKLYYTVSHDPADYERFYRDMYVPYAQGRFGDMAYLRSPRRLRRQFEKGGLVWINDEQQQLGGWVFSLTQDMIRSYVLGVDQGLEKLVESGVFTATYAFGIELAHQLGKRYYHAGFSRPSLADGVLVYKKRWGAGLPATQPTFYDVCVRWDRFTPAVAKLLRETPLIVRDGRALSGLAATPEPPTAETLGQLTNQLAMPGLHRLWVTSSATGNIPTDAPSGRHAHEIEVQLVPEAPSKDLSHMLLADD